MRIYGCVKCDGIGWGGWRACASPLSLRFLYTCKNTHFSLQHLCFRLSCRARAGKVREHAHMRAYVCARPLPRSFRIMFLAYMVMCTELIITWVRLRPPAHRPSYPAVWRCAGYAALKLCAAPARSMHSRRFGLGNDQRCCTASVCSASCLVQFVAAVVQSGGYSLQPSDMISL